MTAMPVRPRASSAMAALLIAAVATAVLPAVAQEQAESGQPAQPQPTVQPGRGFGLGGVRATVPQTNTINSTPILQRRGRPLLPPPPAATPQTDRSPMRPIVVIPPPRRPIVVHPRYRRPDNDRVFGSGLTVDGSFRDDDSDLRIHIGSDPGKLLRRRRGRHDDVRYVWPYGPAFYDWYDRPRYPIDGQYSAIDPTLTPAEADEPAPPPPIDLSALTPLERGDFLLRVGEPVAAAEGYREHLQTNPDDAAAMRSLAVALLDAKSPQVAAAVMALAYRTNPSLTEQPIDGWILPGGPRDLRTLVQRASIYANRTKTASAWLTLAVLMQGEGRTDVAVRMIERSRAAGLDPALADRFRTAMGVKPLASP